MQNLRKEKPRVELRGLPGQIRDLLWRKGVYFVFFDRTICFATVLGGPSQNYRKLIWRKYIP